MKLLRTAPFVAVLCLSCVQQPASDAALDVVREAGLRVGLAVEPPWAFFDSLGRPTGEAPEVLRAVARELDIDDIRWLHLEFQELPGALHAGRIDVIAAGMFITEPRGLSLRFSVPTLCVGPALVQSSDHPPAVWLEQGTQGAPGAWPDSDPDCRDCRISVLDNSVEQFAVEALGVEPRRLLVVPDVATGVAAVRSGEAGALLVSGPTARRLARRDAALVVRELPAHGPPLSDAEGCAAFAFRPEDEALAAAFDQVLESWLGTVPHLEIMEAFGFDHSEVVPADLDVVPNPGRTP